MNSFKIAICDDDAPMLALYAGAIENCFAKYDSTCSIDSFPYAKKLQETIADKVYDIIFLDIEMPEMDGISLGRYIRNKYRGDVDTEIVYISNREDKVFDTFDIRPLGFIRKRNFVNDCIHVIRLYLSQHAYKKSEFVEIKSGSSIVKMNMRDIIYLECLKDYQYIYTLKEAPVKIKTTMTTLEELLSAYGFIRIHKGYIVNYKFIQAIDKRNVILLAGNKEYTLPVSGAKLTEIRKLYLKLMHKDDVLFTFE
ncbi:MAG TPA: hypothetical protein DDY77_03410 [Clostridiales bacterium]|nr:hypothetical protein [Clostridiales bacterium]